MELSSPGIPALTQVTDAKGAFTFHRVPAASYVLRSPCGLLAVHQSRISVQAERDREGRRVLRPGSLTETVNVTAETPRIDGLSAEPSMKAPAGPPLPASSPVARGAMPYGGYGGYVWPRGFNTEAYDRIDDNAFRRVADEPLSTFSIDVDTASYANVRRFLNERHAAAARTPCASRS